MPKNISFQNDDNLPEHVVSQLGEEWLLNEVLVVLLQKFLSSLLSLHGAQLVSLLFESADDVSDDSTLTERFCKIQVFHLRQGEHKHLLGLHRA